LHQKFLNKAGLIGIGSSVPQRVLTNFDLEKMVDTSDEWIVKRTGVKERRILEEGRPAYEIGVEAANNAISNAGISAEDIDLIIVTTETPDYLAPSSACIIQNEIGAINASAFDLNAACTGFIYGLMAADNFVKTNTCNYVLVVACEGLSRAVDWEDRNTCVLLGDAAGAAVIGKVNENRGIIATYTGADGSLGKNITIPCCYLSEEEEQKRIHSNKHTVWMNGNEVYKFAIKVMEQSVLEVLIRAKLTLEDIKFIVPHQANIRIVEAASKRLGIELEKNIISLHKYGNTSSASIPVAMDEAYREGCISDGDYILLVGFGGGLTWGSTIIRWGK